MTRINRTQFVFLKFFSDLFCILSTDTNCFKNAFSNKYPLNTYFLILSAIHRQPFIAMIQITDQICRHTLRHRVNRETHAHRHPTTKRKQRKKIKKSLTVMTRVQILATVALIYLARIP